ncbi:Neutral ceramidase [Globisporangium polare]
MLAFLHSTPVSAAYRVGVGKRDITGPAGEIGMMGYGDLGQTTAGILSRLYARAYVIEDDADDSDSRVLVVHCDLHAIYQLEHQEVIARLKAKYNGLYTEQNVVLHASHTHAGPGGASAYFLYDLTILGFVGENFDAIVDGILDAVDAAHTSLAPGTVRFSKGTVVDGGVNRSPEAYAANPEDERLKYTTTHDTDLTLLQFHDDASNELIGLLAFYPVHPVSLTQHNRLITGDNKGYAEFLLETQLPGVIAGVGISNAGDVSPNLMDNGDGTFRGEGETDVQSAEIIGKRQADKVLELLKAPSELLTGSVAGRLSYVDFANVTLKDREASDAEPYAHRTCPGLLGQNFGAGTEDGGGLSGLKEGDLEVHRVFRFLSSVVKRTPEWVQACHTTNKVPLLATGLMWPVKWVPEILPVQVVKLGQVGLAVTNFEVSTMAGRRIRATVLEALASVGVTGVEVAAMSNAYAQYVTTKEEYMTQHYEGASTLFGPNQLEALQQELQRVAASIVDPSIHVDVGPEPQQFSKAELYSFQTPVVLDTPGWEKSFGDVRLDIYTSAVYLPGSTVKVEFYGGHPRNQFRDVHSFCDVEREQNNGSGGFETVLTDSHWDVRFLWTRKGLTESKSACHWLIRRAANGSPSPIVAGRYRIRHRGFYKAINGETRPYEGLSSVFHVALEPPSPERACVAESCEATARH